MIIFNEKINSTIVSLGYGTCGIGIPDEPLPSGEWAIIIDANNEEAKEIGRLLKQPATLRDAVVITFPTKAQAEAVRDAIFRFKQDEDGNFYDGGVAE